MVDALADPAVEAEIKKVKTIVMALQKTQLAFAHTFSNMSPRERAATIQKIKAEHKIIFDFLNNAQKFDLRAPSLKFGVENIRQQFQMVMNIWRKHEKNFDNLGVSRMRLEDPLARPTENQSDPTAEAVGKYTSMLENLGHAPTEDMVKSFRSKLETAYKAAKEKSGGKDLAVHILEDNGKIKVKMTPK